MFVAPPVDWIIPHTVYSNCVRNEYSSLVNRHLLMEGEPTKEVLARVNKRIDLLVDELDVPFECTEKQVLANKQNGMSYNRYLNAFRSLRNVGPQPKWAKVKAFVKVEKWPVAQMGVKAPRLIQHRSYQYCAEISRPLLAIEESLWKLCEQGIPVFSKKLNTFTTAQALIDAASRFSDPVFVLLDHSKFDSSVSKPWLEVEHQFYQKVLPDLHIAKALQQQLHNEGKTHGNIRYRCEGRRMSGDYNTSLGNSLINYFVIEDVFRDVLHFALINGDDSVVTLERSDLAKVNLGSEVWASYGFKTTVGIVSELEEIDFCQAHPIQIRPGKWRMVREPRRAVSRSLISVKRYRGEGWYRLAASMGQSELACSDGVPIMQSWANYMLRAGRGRKVIQSELTRTARHESCLSPTVKAVQPIARDSFHRAFGIDAEEQKRIERWLDTTTTPPVLVAGDPVWG